MMFGNSRKVTEKLIGFNEKKNLLWKKRKAYVLGEKLSKLFDFWWRFLEIKTKVYSTLM